MRIFETSRQWKESHQFCHIDSFKKFPDHVWTFTHFWLSDSNKRANYLFGNWVESEFRHFRISRARCTQDMLRYIDPMVPQQSAFHTFISFTKTKLKGQNIELSGITYDSAFFQSSGKVKGKSLKWKSLTHTISTSHPQYLLWLS